MLEPVKYPTPKPSQRRIDELEAEIERLNTMTPEELAAIDRLRRWEEVAVVPHEYDTSSGYSPSGDRVILSDGFIREHHAADRNACPCVIADEPCSDLCPCVMPQSSRGCMCCARYGSAEQRKIRASQLTAEARARDRLWGWEYLVGDVPAWVEREEQEAAEARARDRLREER